MNASNDDLDLKSLWQDTPTPDVDALLKRVHKSRRRMWQILCVELVSTAGALAMLCIYSLWGVFGANLWFPIGAGALAVAVQAWTWRWRRGLWSALSDAPLDLLRLQRKRTRLNLKVARYYLWGTPISIVVGIAFALLAVDEQFSTGLSDLIRGALLALIFGLVALTLVYGWRMARRCKRELVEIDARIAQFEDAEK